ncbi:FMN-binding protein [Eggerthellaceae bacterium zg-1084]|uniref:FMN-binding protein n=1 Tax=Berryella wangjianweii TaxID=2734634 RepID=A0A6M8J3Z7_9ACTN|nr:FMN-binding protein [Berryella wangjianweii]NPD31169.1 FMN-binding protein [Berryella wangjianweii]NPD32522.1 FMN-binding protein [Eggerthellaceae bacterium zg-997]QKF06726.1 FMN-binding protein [Berryella wangjianweii]
MMRRNVMAVGGATVLLAAGLTGCGHSFEGSGTKDAASAEQLAMHTPNSWIDRAPLQQRTATGTYADGEYTGVGKGMDGLITVTLQVEGNKITCTRITQEGETQSVGGYEAIRDGVYAQMIDAAQDERIDAIAGATITTQAVRTAVADALEQAAAAAAGKEVQHG